MPTKLFKKGNQYGRIKKKNHLSIALTKHNKALTEQVVKKALEGNERCLLWLLEREHGRKPANPIKLKGDESSKQLLQILKTNIDLLPTEILESMSDLINTNLKVKETTEVIDRLDALENPKKGKKK